MEENQKSVFIPHSNFHKIIIAEVVCAVLIILILTAVKFLNHGCFLKLEKFYTENILEEVTAEEVLENFDPEVCSNEN